MKRVFKTGLIKGLHSGWFLIKITVPTSFAVSCLDFLGIIDRLAGYFKPLMKIFGLPGEAVFPLVSAALVNIYSSIAVITSLPGVFTLKDLNIIAVMALIAHNLIIETAIQKKCGMKVRTIIFTRILTAMIAGLALNWLIFDPGTRLDFAATAGRAPESFGAFIWKWSLGVSYLTAKILLIIVTLMLLYEFLNHFHLIRRFSAMIAPVMKALALSPGSAFIWIASTFVGLAYGGGIIIAEVQSGRTPPDDLARLNLSIAVSHSLLEDTLLFVVIGAGFFWCLVPRIVLSVLVIHTYNLVRRLEFRPA